MDRPQKYYGKVVKIIDGDTYKIKDKNGNTQTIRLLGIDTPEKNQEYGMVAKKFIQEIIEGKEVFVVPVALGQYGRVIAHIKLNGKAIAETLLENGMAFASGNNHKYAHHYYALEQRARINKTGIWKKYNENPAEFRRRLRVKKYRNNPLEKKYDESITNKMDIKLPPPRKGLLTQLIDFVEKITYREEYKELEKERERIARNKEKQESEIKNESTDEVNPSYEGVQKSLKRFKI